MSLDAFERAINEVSDKDWSWWPFLWLRPKQDEPLSLTRMFAVAMLYGLPVGALSVIGVGKLRPEENAMLPFLFASFPMMFLFMTSVIVGPMWNRRAERLRARARSLTGADVTSD